MEMYLQFGDSDSGSISVDHKVEMLDWQKKGLTYTASGYGGKIPTAYKIKFNNRWRRLYAMIYSNSGTYFAMINGQKITAQLYN